MTARLVSVRRSAPDRQPSQPRSVIRAAGPFPWKKTGTAILVGVGQLWVLTPFAVLIGGGCYFLGGYVRVRTRTVVAALIAAALTATCGATIPQGPLPARHSPGLIGRLGPSPTTSAVHPPPAPRAPSLPPRPLDPLRH